MAEKKILLDAPTDRPALGYERIAAAFADIIINSQPNFAIGIFGGWGSGKTTLMGAIKTALPAEGLITVDFNAWRFEREPHLLGPLLDTIRGAFAHRAALGDKALGTEGKFGMRRRGLRKVAGRVGRVVRALATGLSGSVGIPGAVTIKYNASAAIAALTVNVQVLGLAAAVRDGRSRFGGGRGVAVVAERGFGDDPGL